MTNIFTNTRFAASAFGCAAGGRNRPIDNRHVPGHVHEEREISKQAHLVRLGGRKNFSIQHQIYFDILSLFRYRISSWLP